MSALLDNKKIQLFCTAKQAINLLKSHRDNSVLDVSFPSVRQTAIEIKAEEAIDQNYFLT